MAGNTSLKKKLTVRDIMGGNVSMLEQVAAMIAAGVSHANGKGAAPKPVILCQIIGRTDKAKPGSTEKGEFVRFVGEFIGINSITGERVSSGGCILPGAAESMVYGAIGPLNERGHSERTVDFALEISAKFDATSATKYVFDVRSLVETKASDPLTALLAAAGVGDVKQIAAPAGKK